MYHNGQLLKFNEPTRSTCPETIAFIDNFSKTYPDRRLIYIGYKNIIDDIDHIIHESVSLKLDNTLINFLLTHARGAFIALFMPAGRCDQLNIPSMATQNSSFNNTKFRIDIADFF